MEEMAIGRHLLEAKDEVAMATEGLPMVAIITGVVAAVVIIVVLALCTCKDKADSDESQAQSLNKTVTPVLDQKAQATNMADAADVTVDVEGASSILRHSANGSAVRDSTESRPKSHDQRALPEIPATSAALTSQTDEDDETDGHYDVISSSRNRRGLAITPAKVVAPLAEDEISPIRTHPRPKRAHDYEAVDIDGESLSPYATGQEMAFPMYDGCKDEENNSEQGSYGTVKNPYATVENVGHAHYAHIEERRDKSGNRDIERVRGRLGSAPQASTETLDDESYSSVSAPPIPDKNFEEQGSNVPSSRASNSPRLPPRNGGASAQEGAIGLLGGNSADGAAGADIGAISVNGNENGGTSGKREPPYSRVTARESLAHLREREAQALMAAAPVDATYECVDYDLVKMPSAGASSGQAGDRNSLTSDLYAEISMGENSTRSSVYARVDEVPSNPHAPTPPPVDILKTLSLPPEAADSEMGDPGYSVIRRSRPQSAIGSVSPEMRGQENPVYAKVDWKKKHTRASVHVSENVQAQDVGASGRVDFVNPYAEVKSVNPYSKIKSRNMNGAKREDPYTEVNIDRDQKSKDVDPYAKVKDVDPYARVKDVDPYSKVKDVDPYSKVKDVDPYSRIKEVAPFNPYADISTIVPISPGLANGAAANGHNGHDEYRGTGARPKIRENGATSPTNHDTQGAGDDPALTPAPFAPRQRFDPGYSTIGSVMKDAGDGGAADTVDGGSPRPVTRSFDPNYETVAINGCAATAPSCVMPPNYSASSSGGCTNGEASSGSPPGSPPVAPVIPPAIPPTVPPARQGRREHIYQEISDARLEKDKVKRASDQSAASSADIHSTAV